MRGECGGMSGTREVKTCTCEYKLLTTALSYRKRRVLRDLHVRRQLEHRFVIGKPTFVELCDRVRESIQCYNGSLPERAALVWDGYYAACLEWGLITVNDHARIIALLPKIEDNPVMHVFLGWNKEHA